MSFFTNKMDWTSRKGKTVIVLISFSVLLPLIGNLLSEWSYRYPSKWQAKQSCYEWIGLNPNTKNCSIEVETKQFLGRQRVIKNDRYTAFKIVRHFRY